jgi:DNA-directed RNA polymerases I, II, and III subunit RPABC3
VSKVNQLQIELDVNSDIYPMAVDECYKLVLASSVNADGSEKFDIITYQNQGSGAASGGMGQLIDQYDYVMHGKIFKYQPGEQEKTM